MFKELEKSYENLLRNLHTGGKPFNCDDFRGFRKCQKVVTICYKARAAPLALFWANTFRA